MLSLYRYFRFQWSYSLIILFIYYDERGWISSGATVVGVIMTRGPYRTRRCHSYRCCLTHSNTPGIPNSPANSIAITQKLPESQPLQPGLLSIANDTCSLDKNSCLKSRSSSQRFYWSTVTLVVFIIFTYQPLSTLTLRGIGLYLNGTGNITIGLNVPKNYVLHNNIGRFQFFF